MNNRLDFIGNFKNNHLATLEMSTARQRFMEIDEELRKMAEQHSNDYPLARALALAREHVESALFYTIKSLCLKHEAN